MTEKTIERLITPAYDRRGNPQWKSIMSAPDASVAVVNMIPDRIIPVIFVPGVMGSNLKGIGRAAGVDWTLNSNLSMLPWLARGAQRRKQTLTPATMEVDDRGVIPTGTLQGEEELQRRGWGEVGAISYAAFLVWLENALNDFDNPAAGERVRLMNENLGAMLGEAALSDEAVGLSYRYRFAVHACGYNWLDSNAHSANRLAQRIDDVIARYRRDRKKCEKVILVTHSMGGLVARYCSELAGMKDKILGVVHGVMPTLGAAAVYRRFKAGTEFTPWYSVLGATSAAVLGDDAGEMTAVLSSAPGPLQLLPTAEYGNGWLQIKDGKHKYSFPKDGDPYSEIYAVRGKWWSMCEDRLMNPLNEERDPKKRQAQTDSDWQAFEDTIEEKVKPFHESIRSKYHSNTCAFFGSDNDKRAYGKVTWTGNGGGWLRGDRPADVLGARPVGGIELGTTRTAAAPLGGTGWATGEHQSYSLSEPEEAGDGTVPHRSGVAAKDFVRAFLQVDVGHEPAFNHTKGQDNLRACRFTLRSIVLIAQAVQETSLRYE
ncbi:MAG: hypothetical protein H0W40_08405 [Methylibium sp.]|uniref:esterase/lipase family protein n=1 Tax=Methylibium sp. TaxID=2067992 RepID=UPI001859E5C1|nr:hypothetical protein [Methylibium sp.]MBA3597385.1 hypothetical protein [Methylibium sp.]